MSAEFFDTHPQKFYLLSVNCRRLMSFESADHSLEQAVEEAFVKLSRKTGGNVHAEYVYEPSMLEVMNKLSENWKARYPNVQQLPAFMRQLKEGDLFIRHQAWAPLPDLKRSLATLKAISLGIDPSTYDTYFVLNWGRLYLLFDTYSFGFLTDKIYVGEDNADLSHEMKQEPVPVFPLASSTGASDRYRKRSDSSHLVHRTLTCPLCPYLCPPSVLTSVLKKYIIKMK